MSRYSVCVLLGLGCVATHPALATGAPVRAEDVPKSSKLLRLDLPSHYTEATCNDGSPYAIYHRPGFGSGKKRLVVWFQGGGSCQDEASCVERWSPGSPLMSSDGWGPTRAGEAGLLSTDPSVSPLAGDAIVFLPYCSSDAFVGTRAPFYVDGLPFDLRFAGTHIAEAVIDLLVTAPPPNIPALDDATRIVVAGNSAGTGGVLGHADRFAGAAGARTEVYAIANAGWLFDYPSQNRDVVAEGGIAPYFGTVADFWQARMDDTCDADAQAQNTPEARATCLLGAGAAEYIDTPTFVAMAQRDPMLMHLLQPLDVDDMTAAFRDTLLGASIEGGFSLDNAAHGYLHTTALLQGDGMDVSPAEVLQAFLDQPGDASAFHVSD